jgi:HEAT repeat protein
MTADRPQGHRSGERRRAVAISGHRGEVGVASAHLDDPDPSVRATALGALARADALESAHLQAALADDIAEVRRRALTLAARRPHDPGLDVVGALSDPDDTVVEMAAWCLGEQDPPDPGAVEPLCRIAESHADSLCREAAVAALGSLGDPRALPTVLAATRDIATVRRRAVIALAPFEGPDVDAALVAARDDRDWQVRQAAEDLLAD